VDVLLVGDDEDLLLVLTYALRQRGQVVATAPLGSATRARWRDMRPQVIVVDEGSPPAGTWPMAAHLRADIPTPCILLTPRSGSLAAAARLGWAAALLKPFRLADLVRAIEQVRGRIAGEPADDAELAGERDGR
jgi:DNA-binding response OmpR family regulator